MASQGPTTTSTGWRAFWFLVAVTVVGGLGVWAVQMLAGAATGGPVSGPTTDSQTSGSDAKAPLTEAPNPARTDRGGSPSPTATVMYPNTTLRVQGSGCGREDDIDLDVPEHPALASAAEIDFDYCFQGQWYIYGKNGAIVSTAAPSDADRSQCLQAVEEEPATTDSDIALTTGDVVCVVHYNDEGQLRVFRVTVNQVPGNGRKTIALTSTGWR